VDDLAVMALTSSRAEFVSRCAFPLLYAINRPQPQKSQDLYESEEATTAASGELPEPPAATVDEAPRQLLYAVRKVHTILPHAIVLGRASASDILIRDRQISKAHAMFQFVGDRWELSDLGSRNGTFIDNLRLEPRGEAGTIPWGAVLSFGHRAFYFLDAGEAWDRATKPRPT
jgi:pSer/pThr/pTyr-binding forkhead associated (FHA) protein